MLTYFLIDIHLFQTWPIFKWLNHWNRKWKKNVRGEYDELKYRISILSDYPIKKSHGSNDFFKIYTIIIFPKVLPTARPLERPPNHFEPTVAPLESFSVHWGGGTALETTSLGMSLIVCAW